MSRTEPLGKSMSMLVRIAAAALMIVIAFTMSKPVGAQVKRPEFAPNAPVVKMQVIPLTKGSSNSLELYYWYPYYIQRNFNYSAAQYVVSFYVGTGYWAHKVRQFNGTTYTWEGYYCPYTSGCNYTMTYSGFGSLSYQRVYGNSALYYR